MRKRQRERPDSGIHHVMNRGVNRGAIFFGDADRVEFGLQLDEIHTRFNVSTLAYCLMGNHYHLLLRAPDGNLPLAMQRLGSLFVRHTNSRVGRDGPMFRSRYHAIPVTTDEYLTWVSRYIHRNPLEILGQRPLLDYRWSSLRTYLGLRAAPAFLDDSVVLSYFAGDRHRYRQFVVEPGSDAPPTESLESLRSGVGLAIAEEHMADTIERPWQGIERTALTLVADALPSGPLREEVLHHLAFPTDGARRAAFTRARQRADAHPALTRIVQRVA